MPIQNVSLNTPFSAEQQDIERQRRMAQALQEQSLQPIQGGMAGNIYVAPSWTQGAAQLAKALVGSKGQARASEQSQDLARRRSEALAAALQGMPIPQQQGTTGEGMTGGLDMQDYPRGAAPGDTRTVQPTMQQNAAWLGQLANVGPDAVGIGGTMLGMQQKQAESAENRAFRGQEAQLAREARAQELQMRLADQRISAADRAALQRELAQMQIAGREDLARLAAGLRPPQQPQAPVAVMGPDNQPIYVQPGQAVGMRPASGAGRPMSATAQKELIETDEQIQGGQAALDLFKQARALNDKAMGFTGAGAVASAGSLLPEAIRPGAIDATQDLDNILQSAALPQLKAIFGGMPTEGERKILLDVQGSSSKPPAVRKQIFDRAQKAIENRMKFSQDKSKALRSGTYFSGDGGVSPAAPPSPEMQNRRASDQEPPPGAVRRLQ